MLTPVLTKTFNAGGAIPAYSWVKFGADDRTVVVAAAATDAIIGLSTSLPAASGERVDVILAGIGEAVLAGNVTRGGLVTSNSAGACVAAAPSAGANNRVGGTAFASGVSGDVIPVLVVPHQIQGA